MKYTTVERREPVPVLPVGAEILSAGFWDGRDEGRRDLGGMVRRYLVAGEIYEEIAPWGEPAEIYHLVGYREEDLPVEEVRRRIRKDHGRAPARQGDREEDSNGL